MVLAKDGVFITKSPMSSGASGEILTVFLAKDPKFEGIGKRGETRDIEVLKIPIDNLNAQLSQLRSQ